MRRAFLGVFSSIRTGLAPMGAPVRSRRAPRNRSRRAATTAGVASTAVMRLESQLRAAGLTPGMASIKAWDSLPMVARPGALDRVSNSRVEPERGELTMKIGRSNTGSPTTRFAGGVVAGAGLDGCPGAARSSASMPPAPPPSAEAKIRAFRLAPKAMPFLMGTSLAPRAMAAVFACSSSAAYSGRAVASSPKRAHRACQLARSRLSAWAIGGTRGFPGGTSLSKKPRWSRISHGVITSGRLRDSYASVGGGPNLGGDSFGAQPGLVSLGDLPCSIKVRSSPPPTVSATR